MALAPILGPRRLLKKAGSGSSSWFQQRGSTSGYSNSAELVGMSHSAIDAAADPPPRTVVPHGDRHAERVTEGSRTGHTPCPSPPGASVVEAGVVRRWRQGGGEGGECVADVVGAGDPGGGQPGEAVRQPPGVQERGVAVRLDPVQCGAALLRGARCAEVGLFGPVAPVRRSSRISFSCFEAAESPAIPVPSENPSAVGSPFGDGDDLDRDGVGVPAVIATRSCYGVQAQRSCQVQLGLATTTAVLRAS